MLDRFVAAAGLSVAARNNAMKGFYGIREYVRNLLLTEVHYWKN